MKVKQNDQEYNRYVEAITPKHSCFKNCLHAFLVGGCICLLGQVIFNVCTTQFHYEEADAMSVCSILLVFLRPAYGVKPLQTTREIWWCRCSGSDYRICEFRCRPND